MITPELLGEMIFDVVDCSIKPLLDPRLTASWEKGLTQVAEGEISAGVYMDKLNDYVARRTDSVRTVDTRSGLKRMFERTAQYYNGKGRGSASNGAPQQKASREDG